MNTWANSSSNSSGLGASVRWQMLLCMVAGCQLFQLPITKSGAMATQIEANNLSNVAWLYLFKRDRSVSYRLGQIIWQMQPAMAMPRQGCYAAVVASGAASLHPSLRVYQFFLLT